jgi:hypothetical protein
MLQTATWPKILGTALICGGLLAYEILSSRLLSVVLEGHLVVFAIALAMLGMGAANAFFSSRPAGARYTASTVSLSHAATILGVVYVVSVGCLTLVNDSSNAVIETAIDTGGLDALVNSIRTNMLSKMMYVVAVLFAPYFVFGTFMARLFSALSHTVYHRYYAADLIGAAFGCILAVAALDFAGYAGCLALILLSTFLGAAALAGLGSKFVVSVNLALAAAAMSVWSPSVLVHLEPQPALDQLSRNYNKTNDVSEDWHVWNAQSRVALLSIRNKQSGETSQVYAHEDGQGWATVPGTTSNPWSELAVMFKPKRVLVLFAGVGADMVEIDRACGGRCEITGVEINRQMVEHALATGPQELRSFLGKPGIKLEVAEAREYLERDTSHYDVILLSWWGAGTSYYVGTSGKLAQYAYTKEGYASLLRHLSPNGMLILLNSSKAQSLVNFREVFAEEGLGSLAGRAVIMKKNATDGFTGRLQFYDILEDMRLIIKPSGFSAADMDAVQATANDLGADIVLSPARIDPAYAVYGAIVDGKPLDDINRELIATNDVELSIVTEDRPYINELVPRANYWTIGKWFEPATRSAAWAVTRSLILFTLFLGIAAAALTVGPLLTKNGPRLSGRTVTELMYFLALGSGFMLIEVGFVRKLGLLLGNPSYSISIVLASLILATGLGSICSDSLFRSGMLTVRRTALSIVVYVVLGSALYTAAVDSVIALPLLAKCVIVILFLMPLGFLMGQLFPQGLARVGREDTRLVPWAWAINSATSTICVGASYILSYPLGFNALLYLGAALYLGLVFLPLSRQAENPAAFAGVPLGEGASSPSN